MNRRRPLVRTVVAASVLTVTGCHINPPDEPFPFDATEVGADASSEDVSSEEVAEDVSSEEVAEDAQRPGPELPPVAENPAPEPEE